MRLRPQHQTWHKHGTQRRRTRNEQEKVLSDFRETGRFRFLAARATPKMLHHGGPFCLFLCLLLRPVIDLAMGPAAPAPFSTRQLRCMAPLTRTTSSSAVDRDPDCLSLKFEDDGHRYLASVASSFHSVDSPILAVIQGHQPCIVQFVVRMWRWCGEIDCRWPARTTGTYRFHRASGSSAPLQGTRPARRPLSLNEGVKRPKNKGHTQAGLSLPPPFTSE